MGKNANKRKSQPQHQSSKARDLEESKHNPWGNTGLAVKVGRDQKQMDDLMMKERQGVAGGSVFEAVRGKLTKGVVGQVILGFVALGVLGVAAAQFFRG